MIALWIFVILGRTRITVLALHHGECEFWSMACTEPEQQHSLAAGMLQIITGRTTRVNSSERASSNSEPYSEDTAVGKHRQGQKTPEQHGIDNTSEATSTTTSNITDSDVLKQTMSAELQIADNHITRHIPNTRLHAFLAQDVLSNSSSVTSIGQNATKYIKSAISSALKLSTSLQTAAFSFHAAALEYAKTSTVSSALLGGLLVLGLLLLILCCGVMVLDEHQPNQDQEKDMIIQSKPNPASVESWAQPTRSPRPINLIPNTDSTLRSPESNGSLRFPCLCSELIVPGNRECTLLVPVMRFKEAGSVEFTVDDATGVPIFNASSWVQRTDGSFGQALDEVQVKLLTCQGAVALAYCQLQQCKLEPRGNSVCLYRTTGNAFGELRPAGPGYTFSLRATLTPRQAKLDFNEHLHSISVVDETGGLIALVEKAQGSTTHRCVRIGPLVDCAFVVLSLFGVDMLQAFEADWRGASIQSSPLPTRLALNT